MSWMNASAVAAADRILAAQSDWDHSVASSDGMGRRSLHDHGGYTDPPAPEYGQMTIRTEAELKAAADKAAAKEAEMLAAMLAEGGY